MIRYALKCSNDHGFESWFSSSSSFDDLRGRGHVACPHCGDADVDKALMAPSLPAGRDTDGPSKPNLSTSDTPVEEKLRKLRAMVEKNADYVGRDFARQARAIHDGDSTDRPIWGEARPDEAKKLLDDGIPVAPLPFLPSRKAN